MGSVNLYAYCRNNPVNLVDPSGFGPGYGGSGYGDGGDGFGEGGGSGGSGGVLGGDGGPGDDAMDLAREVEQTEHLVADLGDALASTAAVVLPAVDMAAGAADEAAEAAAEAGSEGGLRADGAEASNPSFNPFRGKSPQEIHDTLTSRGYDPRGPDPAGGLSGYVNPSTGRSYHIDAANSFGEGPHVDVNRPKTYHGPLGKRKFPF